MQDAINPDVNSPNVGDESETDVHRDNQEMPTPPDREPGAPVEEPPEIEKPPIKEGDDSEPKRIV